MYGEDGMDVCRSSFIHPSQFDFFYDNLKALRANVVPLKAENSKGNFAKFEELYKKVSIYYLEIYAKKIAVFINLIILLCYFYIFYVCV